MSEKDFDALLEVLKPPANVSSSYDDLLSDKQAIEANITLDREQAGDPRLRLTSNH